MSYAEQERNHRLDWLNALDEFDQDFIDAVLSMRDEPQQERDYSCFDKNDNE